MHKSSLLLVAVLLSATATIAQGYNITIQVANTQRSKLYLGQHYRDGFIYLDSAQVGKNGTFVFKGKKPLSTGIYTLIGQDKSKSLTDFTVDDSQKFTLSCDSSFTSRSMKVTGSNANTQMYAFKARNDEARAQARDIGQRQKSSDPKVKEQATKEMEALSKTMQDFEAKMRQDNAQYYFFKLQSMFAGPEVPDEVSDKPLYYRSHYWDDVDFNDHSLVYTPDLFDKLNYYFYGILFYSDADTICRYADLLLSRIERDTVMMRYVMEFITPRYYRSTKQIGWDYVWAHLVRNYYLTGKCPFATKGDINNKRIDLERISKSLIGAQGIELFMADTNQSPNADDWISSHQQPYKYVILWFWDPDCHHCQEQTAKLITLYDSLTAAGTRNFEVYAIGYESDVPKWKRYVKEHKLPFINVGGPNVNVDYQDAYNIHGAPTMIILNADRQVIMNKTLAAGQLLAFFKQYEQLHPEQANRPPSQWMLMGQANKKKH